MTNILIIAEHQDGKVKKYSFELASKAAELAPKLGGGVVALLIGGSSAIDTAELGKYGVKKVVTVENEALKFYNSDGYSKIVCDVAKSENASVILGSATPMGKDLCPTVAAKLKVGFTQDCTALDIENGKLKIRRPVFAGKALIDLNFQTGVQVATARPNSFAVKESAVNLVAVKLAADPGNMRAKVREMRVAEKGEADVSEADVVVSGGRALASEDNFKMLYELAHVLKGAAVGASRAAVDAGYISHDHQVGQTGKTVNPKLYIACGISGAIQHLAGMRTSKVIVAINKDPEAPIFSRADFGIVGDLFKIVPALTESLKKVLHD